MSGLNDLDENLPTGNNSPPTMMDDEIRALKAKLKEYAAPEHAYDGKHKFLITSLLPANDAGSNRLVIKTTIGLPDELWYDNGTWKKITSNSEIAEIIADLLAHRIATVIDHPDLSITTNKYINKSVTSSKVGDGSIMRHHLDAAQSVLPDSPTSALVNGSELDSSWHTHPTGNTVFGMNFLSAEIVVGSGTNAQDWTTCNATNISNGVIPVIAKGVILRISFGIFYYSEAISYAWGRASISSGIFLLQSVDAAPYTFVQVLCPLNGIDGSFQYKIDFYSMGTWDIILQGYFT